VCPPPASTHAAASLRWSAGGGGADSSALDIEDEVFYEDGEEDGEMGDMPSAAMKLEAVLPKNYDEDASTTTAMAASLEDEEARWSLPGLEDVIQLWQMVVEHVASLPSPPSLPPHAPP
jgi:hypothetical protein